MLEDEINEDSLKPLRICRVCNKEAYTYVELKEFKTDYNKKYGVSNICRDCGSLYDWKRHNPDKDINIYFSMKKEKANLQSSGTIKKCIHCGFEISNTADLHLFAKNKKCTYGVLNICKKCKNEQNRIFKSSELIKEKYKAVAKKRATVLEVKSMACVRSNRRRLLLGASWYYLREKKKIDNLYLQAGYISNITNMKYVVDHIYPIKHPLMCGLNVFDNLQILESNINSIKNNNLGYLYQFNINKSGINTTSMTSRENVFIQLGVSMTYAEFLEYEKKHFKEYL